MGDRIVIEGLQADCLIGFAEWERMVLQTVVLDLAVDCDVRAAARGDVPTPEMLNTKSLSKRLQAYVSESQFNLIETLAQRVALLILREFPVTKVKLRLSKPGALRGARNVAVEIKRRRRLAYLDLGTNLEREASVCRALQHLDEEFGVRRTSAVYESDPVGFADQGAFYNVAVELVCAPGAVELRERLRAIEDAMGRVRTANKNGPRNIDLDLLLLDGHDWRHPQVDSQPFVRVPLSELRPELQDGLDRSAVRQAGRLERDVHGFRCLISGV